jgi:hypothetical protein
MSVISAIESALAKAEKTLASWWGKEPAFYNILSVGVNVVGISLETVFTLESNGPASTLVGDIVSKAQQELLAVNTLVNSRTNAFWKEFARGRRNGPRKPGAGGKHHQSSVRRRRQSGSEHGQHAGKFFPGDGIDGDFHVCGVT